MRDGQVVIISNCDKTGEGISGYDESRGDDDDDRISVMVTIAMIRIWMQIMMIKAKLMFVLITVILFC